MRIRHIVVVVVVLVILIIIVVARVGERILSFIRENLIHKSFYLFCCVRHEFMENCTLDLQFK